MATVPIAPFDGTTDSANIQNMLRGTQSPDIKTSGIQIDDDDTGTVDVEFNDDVVLAILDTGGGSVATIAAGDYPNSPRADLGSKAYTVPADDLVLVVPEAGRHVKSTGKIQITVGTGEQVLVWAFRMPAGFIGIPQMNRTSIAAAPTA